MRVIGFLLVWFLTGNLAVAPQDTFRFDLERRDGADVAPGFTHVAPDMVFDAERGWGWVRSNAADRAYDRNTPDSPFYHQYDHPLYNLLRDGVTVIGPNAFRVQVPAGRYRVTLYVGDLSPSEWRPKLFAEVNGVVFLAGDDLPGGQVRAYVGTVEATAEGIRVQVEGRGPQQYFPFDGLVIEPASEEAASEITFTSYPDHTPSPEDYRRNWQRFTAEFLADWERAREELKVEGAWSEDWLQRVAEMKDQLGYRPLFATGSFRVDRLSEKAQTELDVTPLIRALQEAGLDGLIDQDQSTLRALRAVGLEYALMGPGLETLPEAEQPHVTPILLRKPDGTFQEIPGTYSVFDPRSVDLFQRTYQPFLSFPDAAFLTIDEQRGAWFSGGLGDYSEPAQRAFTEWAREQGHADLAAAGIPIPARTWDFYRFYQFRLEASARFVRQVADALPDLKIPVLPGNGLLGPLTVNHSTLHPPAAARLGLGCASWLYGGQKPSAEVLRATEEEWNGHTQAWTAFYLDGPRREVINAALTFAALSEKAGLWHQGTFLTGADRVAWLKALAHVARLAHATSGLTHHTEVFIYTPDSLVYNDLVGDTSGSEAGQWQQLTEAFQAANLDFRVTFLRKPPTGGLVIYSPVRAVLTEEESAAVIRYVDHGGTFVYACATPPERPDGTPLISLAQRLNQLAGPSAPGLHWWQEPATPEKVKQLAEALHVPRNPEAEGLLTFAYRRGEQEVWLLVNRQETAPGQVTLPVRVRDCFSGEAWPAGQSIPVPALSYRMVEGS